LPSGESNIASLISIRYQLDCLNHHFQLIAKAHFSEIEAVSLKTRKRKRLASTVSGNDRVRQSAVCQLASGEGFCTSRTQFNPQFVRRAASSSAHVERHRHTRTGNTMPIRVHVSQLSDEELLAKLGVKRRAKPRELERPHQVALIKWVRSVKGAYPVLKILYAVPNGGKRNFRVARKLKAEGVMAGVADLCLPVT